jgi:hypothetical protein
MRGRVGALMTEMAFVLTSVAVLKEGLFPFLIEHWFTDAEMVSAQLERTAILAGGVTALLYLGLGSAARHVYSLPYIQSLGVFAAVHAPVLIGRIADGSSFSILFFLGRTWEGLLGDALGLFRVMEPGDLPHAALLLTLFLYTAGRAIRIQDRQGRGEFESHRVRIRSLRS